jgi:hypothetical protein
MLWVSGAIAFYPTTVPNFHFSKYLNGRDLFSECVAAWKKRSLRVIARMSLDIQYTDPALLAAHPEWSRRAKDGKLMGSAPDIRRMKSLQKFASVHANVPCLRHWGDGPAVVEPAHEIIDQQLAHRHPRSGRCRSDVRQKHDVGHSDQRRRHPRLVFIDIEPGGKDCSRAQRLDQRALVDDAAARHVDEYAVGPERRQHLATHQVPGDIAAWHDDD